MVNQYYWYRMRAEIGAANSTRRSPTSRRGDPGYVVDVSGAAVLKSSKHQAAAQKFLAYLVSKQAQEIIGTRTGQVDQLRVPDRLRRDHRGPARRPSTSSSPTRSRIAELGTGTTAIALLRAGGPAVTTATRPAERRRRPPAPPRPAAGGPAARRPGARRARRPVR